MGIFAALACGAMACEATSTSAPYTPITGVVIRAASLVAGYGCGEGLGQVYRYVAVVRYAPSADAEADAQASSATWTNISDCFSDGVFENLPVLSNGDQTFTVSIFAYDKKSYDEASLPSSLACTPGMPAADASCVDGIQSVSARAQQLASWTTVCTATQLQGSPALAVCPPLEAAGGPLDAGPPDAATRTDSGTPGAGAMDAGIDG
jgi:hypothetical protein